MNGAFRSNGFTIGGRGYRSRDIDVQIDESPSKTVYTVSNGGGFSKSKTPGYMRLTFAPGMERLRLPILWIEDDVTIDWGDQTTTTLTKATFEDLSNYTDRYGQPLGTSDGKDHFTPSSGYSQSIANSTDAQSPVVEHTYSNTDVSRVVTITGGLIDYGFPEHWNSYDYAHKWAAVSPELSIKYNRRVQVTPKQVSITQYGTDWAGYFGHLREVKISGMSQLRKMTRAFARAALERVDLNEWDSSGVVDVRNLFTGAGTYGTITHFSASFMVWDPNNMITRIPRWGQAPFSQETDTRYFEMLDVGMDLGTIVHVARTGLQSLNITKWLFKAPTEENSKPVTTGNLFGSYGAQDMTTLDLSDWDMSGCSRLELKWWDSVETITIPDQTNLPVGFHIYFSTLPALKSFNISGWSGASIHDLYMNGLSDISEIVLPSDMAPRYLTFSNLNSMDLNQPLSVIDVTNLVNLVITNCNYAYGTPNGNQGFVSLDMSSCPGIGDSALETISIQSTSLETINLNGMKTNPDVCWMHIKSNNNLSTINVGDHLKCHDMSFSQQYGLNTITGKLWLEHDITKSGTNPQGKYGDSVWYYFTSDIFKNTPNIQNPVDFSKFDLSGTTRFVGTFHNSSVLEHVSDCPDWDMSYCHRVGDPFFQAKVNSYMCDKISNLNINIVAGATNFHPLDDPYTPLQDYVNQNAQVNRIFIGGTYAGDLDLTGWVLSGGNSMSSMSQMFDKVNVTGDIDISTWDLGEYSDYSNFFLRATADSIIIEPTPDFRNVTNSISMFTGCDVANPINFNGVNCDFSKLDRSNYMFAKYSTVSPNINFTNMSNWSFPACTSMYAMFWGFENDVDVTGWTFNSTEAPSMNKMFEQTTGSGMQGVSAWDINMKRYNGFGSMFRKCTSIVDMDLTNWTVSAYGTTELPTGSISTSQYTNPGLRSMFEGCTNLETIDMSGWDTSGWSIASVSKMFYQCSKLETVTGIGDWDLRTLADYTWSSGPSNSPRPTEYYRTENMFSSCYNLTNLDLSGWCVQNTDYPVLTQGTGTVDYFAVGAPFYATSSNKPPWNTPCT